MNQEKNELELAMEALEEIKSKFKNEKMKLRKPIKSTDGNSDLLEINVSESVDAYFFLSIPLQKERDGSDYKESICALTGLTERQVLTLHFQDYLELCLYVKSQTGL